MHLIIGGAYQGKRAYAQKAFPEAVCWLDENSFSGLFHVFAEEDRFHRTCPDTEVREETEKLSGSFFHACAEEITASDGLDHLEALLRMLLDRYRKLYGSLPGADTLEESASIFADQLQKSNPDLIVICREMGCGIVPMDPADRCLRELTGRVCTLLAARCRSVTRVVCGIGVRIV